MLYIRKFCITFLLTTMILLLLSGGSLYYFLMNTQIGTVTEIAGLGKVENPDERSNILLIGTDKDGFRADVMMIFSFSDEGAPVNVVSIQRDTEILVNKTNGQPFKVYGRNPKLNELMSFDGNQITGNPKNAPTAQFMQIVTETTGIPIHDYAVVNFRAVETIVDKLGGVDFYVPENMNYEDPDQDLYIHLSAGQQHLNGENALKLLRYRSYAAGDIRRTEVQRDFIQAAFQQKATVENIDKIDDIFGAVAKNVKSDLKVKDLVRYATMAQGCEIQMYAMPHEQLNYHGMVAVDKEAMQALAEAHFIKEESRMTAE